MNGIKIGRATVISSKGRQPSATYDYILSINCENTSALEIQENLYMDWILNVNFIGNKEHFLTSNCVTPNYVHFVNCSSSP